MIIKLTCTPSNEIMTHQTFLNKTVDTKTNTHSSFKHFLLTILNQKNKKKKNMLKNHHRRSYRKHL